MSKTKPIGVRFDEDMLRVFKEDGIADSPQKALNFLSDFYLRNKHHENGGLKVSELFRNINQDVQVEIPIKKKEIQKEVIVKKVTPEKSDDLLERFRSIKIFVIEEFSNYPMKNKPVDINELPGWMKAKKIDDQKIRDKWLEYLKSKK